MFILNASATKPKISDIAEKKSPAIQKSETVTTPQPITMPPDIQRDFLDRICKDYDMNIHAAMELLRRHEEKNKKFCEEKGIDVKIFAAVAFLYGVEGAKRIFDKGGWENDKRISEVLQVYDYLKGLKTDERDALIGHEMSFSLEKWSAGRDEKEHVDTNLVLALMIRFCNAKSKRQFDGAENTISWFGEKTRNNPNAFSSFPGGVAGISIDAYNNLVNPKFGGRKEIHEEITELKIRDVSQYIRGAPRLRPVPDMKLIGVEEKQRAETNTKTSLTEKVMHEAVSKAVGGQTPAIQSEAPVVEEKKKQTQSHHYYRPKFTIGRLSISQPHGLSAGLDGVRNRREKTGQPETQEIETAVKPDSASIEAIKSNKNQPLADTTNTGSKAELAYPDSISENAVLADEPKAKSVGMVSALEDTVMTEMKTGVTENSSVHPEAVDEAMKARAELILENTGLKEGDADYENARKGLELLKEFKEASELFDILEKLNNQPEKQRNKLIYIGKNYHVGGIFSGTLSYGLAKALLER